MNTGGSFVIEGGERILKHRTQQKKTMLHSEKMAAVVSQSTAKKESKPKGKK